MSAPPDWCERPRAEASTAWLGPSANGGRVVPHHRPSTPAAATPAAASAPRPASTARVSTSSSGAQMPAWPLPPGRPQAAPASRAESRRLGAPAPTERMRTGRLTNLTLASVIGSLSGLEKVRRRGDGADQGPIREHRAEPLRDPVRARIREVQAVGSAVGAPARAGPRTARPGTRARRGPPSRRRSCGGAPGGRCGSRTRGPFVSAVASHGLLSHTTRAPRDARRFSAACHSPSMNWSNRGSPCLR